MDVGDKLDKWLVEQEHHLLGLLIAAGLKSSDPDVRGIAGRIYTGQALRGEIAAQRKKEGDDDE